MNQRSYWLVWGIIVGLCPAVLGGQKHGPWSLRTADTVINLGVRDQHLMVLHLGDTQTRSNWMGTPTALALLRQVWWRGQSTPTAWQFTTAGSQEKSNTLRISFTNAQPPLRLTSVWRARPGRGPIEHWVEMENRTVELVTVAQQESLTLSGLQPPPATKLWWIQRGGASATTQGGTFAQPLTNGTRLILTNYCDWGFGDSPVPWLAAQVGDQRGLYVGWEFSGMGRVEAVGRDDALDVSVGVWPDFKTDIASGETLVMPPAFVGCYKGDLEEGSYGLHRFIIEKLRPPLPRNVPDPILTYNLYLDYGMTNATERDVLKSAQFCADLGFEAFMPDAMWYPEVGDWRWDPRRFPRGMAPIRDYVRQRGMRQALWCAWSNGGVSDHPDALSIKGSHPDWFATNAPQHGFGPHYGAKLCFGSPEATAWAKRKTQALVGDFQLDYLKHDCDPIVNHCAQSTHRHRYGVDASYWATLGYYSVQEALRQKFPHLIIEDCSGGGHIKDFGIIQRTHLIATTDMLSNLADRQSMYDTTHAFPPLVLQCYTYDNYWPVKGDEPGTFLWRSAMMGAWHIDPTDTAGWSDEEIESARQSVRIYKNWIRPMFKDVKVFHVLPRADGTNWDGMFFWSVPLKRGTLFVFRPDSPESQRTVILKGLTGSTPYWVWSEDGGVPPRVSSGSELMSGGLPITLPKPYTSDLVYVREARLGRPEALDAPGRFRLKQEKVSADFLKSAAQLIWSEGAHAREYRVLIAGDRDFTTDVMEKRTCRTVLNLPLLPPGRTFHWKVEALSIGSSRWSSNTRSFQSAPLQPRPAGIVFASDLPWIKATAGADNPVRRDANIHDRALRLGRDYHPKGLWTHTFNDATTADVVFDLTGRNYSAFAAEVAVEDSAGRGTVKFEVLVDGEIKAQSPIMRLGAVFPLRVPIANAKQITLRVLNGGDGYKCDHAAWGSARFIEVGASDFIPN